LVVYITRMIAPPTPPSISLSIDKTRSVLHKLDLLEYLPKQRIKALLKSDCLLTKWGENPTHSQLLIASLYTNEREQLQQYLKNYDDKLGGVICHYKKPAHEWGRSFPTKSMGVTGMGKRTRNTLIKDLYYDIDLCSAQIKIIQNLCKSQTPPIPCPMIDLYVADPKKQREDLSKFYGDISPKKIKSLMLRLCFFGTFQGWCYEEKLTSLQPNIFITAFTNELINIATNTKKFNHTLYECARHLKDGKAKNNKNYIGSFYALYLQEYETRIIGSVISHFMNETTLMNHPTLSSPLKVGIYEYDGLKLLKENVDKFEGGLEAVIALATQVITEDTGFNMELEAKEIEDFHDISEFINNVEEDDKPNEALIADLALIKFGIDNGDCGIIETIKLIRADHFIYSVDKTDGSKGDWYGWNGNRWEKSDAPLKMAIMYSVPEYWRGIMEKWNILYQEKVFEKGEEEDCNYTFWKKTGKKMADRIINLKCAHGMTACVCVAKTLMANYTLEFDAKDDLFGCENGVIDIANECFRPYQFDDFITNSCGYNFTPFLEGFNVIDPYPTCKQILNREDYNASYALIMDTYKQIFPDEELRNYFFKIISTGMSGRAIEKFFVFNGAGRNGKGLTNEFLEKVFGNYFVSVSPTIFSENQKNKVSSAANPEIAKLDKKRYIVSKEPQKDAPLNNNVIKDLTGGGTTSARMLYSSKSTVRLCGTNVMECNAKPPFSESPIEADAERINDILFCALFTGEQASWDATNHIYPLDAGLKDQLKMSAIHKNTMLNILLQNLFLVKEQGYNVDFFKPDSVKQRSLAYLQNSYDIHNIFTTLFEKRCEENAALYKDSKGNASDENWTLSKIAGVILKSQEFYDLDKKKQKEYKATGVVSDFFMTNKLYKSWCYKGKNNLELKGWRLKPAVEEDEDE
jgi:phage/plasmid-associated DNA primase